MTNDDVTDLVFSQDYASELPYKVGAGPYLWAYDGSEPREYIQYQNLLDAVITIGLLAAMVLSVLQ